ncbi:tetratricopeptide repeat protein [Pseudoalteromonas luteoviolacea]|uniref:tetratricopeptide repeat protein n=1 Tax=Pseudoalteromonas luteoviolacea TaxID=43657 RepID=UPI0018C8677C|nr:tetratricopeptide repeat protein [Pseudoalteromonas luteoviolacea]
MADEKQKIVGQSNNQNQLVHISLAQQLGAIQNKLSDLDEKLKQQNTLNGDAKSLEETYNELKLQLEELKLLLNQKETILQNKLSNQKEVIESKFLHKEQNQDKQLANFNSRISDLALYLTLGLGVFSILITILAIYLGLSAKTTAIAEAKKAANQASDEHMKEWLENNREELIKQAQDSFEETTKQLKERFDEFEDEQKKQANKFAEIRNVRAKLTDSITSKTNKLDHTHFENCILDAQDWVEIGKDYFLNNQFKLSEIVWDVILFNSLHDNDDLKIVKAYLLKALCLGELGQSEKEIKTYDTLIACFSESMSDAILEQVAMGMLNKGIVQSELEQSENSIETYDALIARFSESENDAILAQVAKGMINKGVAQGELGQSENAVKTYDALIARFSESKSDAILELLARGMINKGIRLGKLGQSENAVKTYDTLITRFSESKNDAILEQVARGVINKGARLGILGQSENAIKTYETLIALFSDSESEEIQILVTPVKDELNKLKSD